MADIVKQRIFSAEQIVVQSDFPKILLEYSKEVIKSAPSDLVAFSKAYFEQKLKDTGFYEDTVGSLQVKHKDLIFRKGEKFHQHYTLGNVIGDVTCSKARVATHKKTKVEKAVKIYDKSTMGNLEYYMSKVQILNTLDHPGVLNYQEIYEDADYFYFVSEYMRGGELYDAIVAKGNYTERDAAYIVKQLLQSVAYLHSKGVVHRNIRAGNILLADAGSLDLKLIDFDFAGVKPAGENFFLKEDGNPVFEAPEVINNNYNEKCDVWAIGCMLYYLVSGSLPFWADYNYQIAEKVLIGKYDLEEGDIWFFVSEDVKDLIRQMLEYDPAKRLSAVEALKHPWFDVLKNENKKPPKDLSKALTNIYEFNSGTKLKQAVLAFFTKNLMSKQEVEQLTQQFQAIDKNGNGTLSTDEIMEAYKNIKGIYFNEAEVADLIRRVDADNSGEIDYSEWMMTAVTKEKLLSQDKLEQAFALFDKDGNKQISYDEVVSLLQSVKSFDKDAVERAVKEIDVRGKGELTFKEFKRFMEKLFEE